MSTPQLRPLGIGEILDVSLKIAWRNAGALVRIVLVVVAPAQALDALIQVSAVPGYRPGASGIFPGGSSTSSGGGWTVFAATIVTTIIGFVAGQLATGASFKTVAQAYLGETTSWRESLRFALARLHSIVWIVVLGGILTVIGFVLLVVPGVYLSVAFAVALPVLLTEGVRGRAALGRSRRLVKGRWWKTAVLLFVAGLLAGIVSAVIGGVVAALAFATPKDPFVIFVVGAVSGIVGSVVVTPFSAAYHTILYFDLRVRREAFDLQLLARHLGVDPPAGWTPAPTFPVEEERDDAPPFWPPPPGWRPRAERE